MTPWDIDIGGGSSAAPAPKPVTPRREIATGMIRKHSADDGSNQVANRYNAAVDAYGPGATFNEGVTYWGTALYSRRYNLAEMDADNLDDSFVDGIADAIRADIDARGSGVPQYRIALIRHGVITALRKMIVRAADFHTGGVSFTPRERVRRTEPKPMHVRAMIAAGRDVRTMDALAALSPDPVTGVCPEFQAVHQIWRLFPGLDDIAYIFRKTETAATPGVLGRSLMRAVDWLHPSCTNPPITAGEQIVPNPFTGRVGTTADGKQSLIAQTCLAAFPHAVLEFDKLPIEDQCSFWAGFVRKSRLPLLCLVYSGGKSIHGCIHVGAPNLETWQAKRECLVSLFASDPCETFHADTEAMRPRTGMRLAGVTRASTGRVQRLLWACDFSDAAKLAGLS